jgi:hypothetical protein
MIAVLRTFVLAGKRNLNSYRLFEPTEHVCRYRRIIYINIMVKLGSDIGNYDWWFRHVNKRVRPNLAWPALTLSCAVLGAVNGNSKRMVGFHTETYILVKFQILILIFI